MLKTVLIVDDSTITRHSLSDLFKREADFDVCGEAENGEEAIEKAQLLQPDLIVLDLAMPVMNGLETARLLSRLMPATPIILYSVYGNRFTEEEAHAAGISAVVSKSENGAELIGKVRSLFKHTAA